MQLQLITTEYLCECGCGTPIPRYSHGRERHYVLNHHPNHGPVRRPLEERFWQKVNKDGPIPEHCPELGQCWIWTSATYLNGYGLIGAGGKYGHNLLAHRVAYELQVGQIPNEMLVCHHCDNRPCIRGTHLFLGNQQDNLIDMSSKRRHWLQKNPERVLLGEALVCPHGTGCGSHTRVAPAYFFIDISEAVWCACQHYSLRYQRQDMAARELTGRVCSGQARSLAASSNTSRKASAVGA